MPRARRSRKSRGAAPPNVKLAQRRMVEVKERNYSASCALRSQIRAISRRKGRAAVGLNDRAISGIDSTVGVHISAEICGRDRLAKLRFGLADVGGINNAVAIRITDQKRCSDVGVWQSLGKLVDDVA